MRRSPQDKQVGFTLIELSIVLVVIGLIVGGIMTSQSLMHAADLRSQVAQFTRFSSALHTFQVKYGVIPGDMTSANANTFGLPASGGNENGVLNDSSGNFPAFAVQDEPEYFFFQLYAAGLIQERCIYVVSHVVIGEQFPQAIIGKAGITGYSNSNGKLVYYWGLYASNTLNVSNIGSISSGWGVVSSNDASSIDGKMDDGIPNTGRVISVQAGSGRPLAGSAADLAGHNCYAGNSYNNYSYYTCQLTIEAQ